MSDETVNVRYMVDDVAARRRLLHHATSASPRHRAPRRRSPTSCAGNLRLLLSGPASSAGRPMPDGRAPGPGGWNRIHFIVDDIAAEVERLRAAGVTLPQRHRHRPRRAADPARGPVRQPGRAVPARGGGPASGMTRRSGLLGVGEVPEALRVRPQPVGEADRWAVEEALDAVADRVEPPAAIAV